MPQNQNRRVATGIIQRGKSYRFTVYLGYDKNRKQIRKTTTFKPPATASQRDADRMAKEQYMLYYHRCKGLSHFNDQMLFAELVDEYMKVYVANYLKPTTAYTYEHQINRYLLPYFENMLLSQINSSTINHFFASHNPNIHSVDAITYSTIQKLHTILQSIFTFAQKYEFIRESPCKNIIIPRPQNVSASTRSYLTYAEIPSFIKLFQDHSSLSTFILTLLYTGMRSGECLALHWKDIDFENKRIYIRYSLCKVSGKYILTTPKTKSGIRYLYMSDSLCTILLQHRQEQAKLTAASAAICLHPEMVFTSATGNYEDRNRLNYQFKKRLKGTPYDFMTLHKLRHTNATLLLNQNIDLKIISEHLGHSNITVTANVYADVLDNTKRETAQVLEKIFSL